MRLEQYDFDLPLERIAQTALPRGRSRLLVLPKNAGPIEHRKFCDLTNWFQKGDCLVVNDTKVIPARLFARKTGTNGKVELLLHRETEPGVWEALARPGRRLKPGLKLSLGAESITIAALLGKGRIQLRFKSAAVGREIIRNYGITPLPPYIRRKVKRPNKEEHKDRLRYQTIFAARAGSVAAPTAGLHFSQAILKSLREKGVNIVPVTLHVGWGTFAPLSEEACKQKKLHPEYYCISSAAAKIINHCRGKGKRIIACGTTTARTLESAANDKGELIVGAGETGLFIYPGYRWKAVDGLLTNFHLPKSSLYMLVCAWGTIPRVRQAYQEAIQQLYRFYSYGDAMLCM